MSLEPSQNGVKIWAVSASKTAFVVFWLQRGFFESFLARPIDQGKAYQIQIRPFLNNIFRSQASTMEKIVEKCSIETSEDRLTVRVFCKQGVVKVHKLHYELVDGIKAKYTKDNTMNQFQVSPKLIKEMSTHFEGKLDEIKLSCGPADMELTSCNAWAPDSDLSKRGLRTTIKIPKQKFSTYAMRPGDVNVSVNLKDFKSVLGFGDSMDQSLQATFSSPGQPFILSLQTGEWWVDFVLATLEEPDQMDFKEEPRGMVGTADVATTSPRVKMEPKPKEPNNVAESKNVAKPSVESRRTSETKPIESRQVEARPRQVEAQTSTKLQPSKPEKSQADVTRSRIQTKDFGNIPTIPPQQRKNVMPEDEDSDGTEESRLPSW